MGAQILKKISFLLIIGFILLVLEAEVSFAENKKFTETCYYNGSKIVSDFNSDAFAATIDHMEPGDTLDYTITYTNKSKKTTYWYFRNKVLQTLEDSKEQAKNGGYTYILKNGSNVLFDNSEVGGEAVVNKLEGLRQATNATENYFFVQELKPGKSQKTKLHVELDGETGVNNYMDTDGALLLSYAVEDKDEAESHPHRILSHPSRIRTGDMNRILYYVMLLVATTGMLVLAVVLWIRSKKRGGDE